MKRPQGRAVRPRGIADDPEWYKDAIIYELRVRSFYDSNRDGIGDLRGLIERLDYLSDLGVTALWLLPFYPSPHRDDGYDISDYTAVHPEVGTLDDFRELLEKAHARGIRIITELVLNHTSDQHPWFQRARRAPTGSPERNFYVWSETAAPYSDARIIFKDFETSNWSWDSVANAYFWHRFYSHQPDLNFENPAVQDALLKAVDFWLALGVDGLRLDAVPYLYEQEGTNCENLPKTHAFLKTLRAHVDANFPNRMLLAEANQWPEDAASYFGNGDECHMNFHFPIMPRMFMAIHKEDSFPIVDILAQTPMPPPSCQWALFLRNHDELTLEMVTDDERDYMYRAYASDTAARINLGIRRRLAPLVGNDRRKIELLNGLLFSLSGTPVIYYGDEIGMGDNIFLGDRNGVRTPMQWTMDRNAGFSLASNQRLILPVNTDSEYHYESLNVEAQQNNSNSLLWWTKRLIALRQDFQAFGRGTLEVLNASNYRILVFLRVYQDETILVVANLARSVQYVELDLSRFKGMRPIELFGGSAFPPITDAPYPLTMSSDAFYWFSIERPLGEGEVQAKPHVDLVTLTGTSLVEILRADLATIEEALPRFLVERGWFRGRGREIQQLRVIDTISLEQGDAPLTCLLVHVDYTDGEPETYPLWVTFVPDTNPRDDRVSTIPTTPLARVHMTSATSDGGGPTDLTGMVIDALDDPPSARLVLEAIAHRSRSAGRAGELATSLVHDIDTSGIKSPPHAIPGIHANFPTRFDERYVLKILREADEGMSIDVELRTALASVGFASGIELLGTLDYVAPRVEPMTLAVLETYAPNAGTVWHQALAELGRYFERILTSNTASSPPMAVPAPPQQRPTTLVPDNARDLMGSFLEDMALLGKRTAELHRALASLTGPAFAPEPYSMMARRSEYQSLRNSCGTGLRQLRQHLARLTGRSASDAAFVLDHRDELLNRFEPPVGEHGYAIQMRVHGNLHLEQVLFTGKDFTILDFDGERDRSFKERRRKRSPLRDVAGLLRSIDNAALVALWSSGTVREVDRELLAPWAKAWSEWMCAAYFSGYIETAEGTLPLPLLPQTPAQVRSLLDTFALERTLHDLREELDWGSGGTLIALRALAQSVTSSYVVDAVCAKGLLS